MIVFCSVTIKAHIATSILKHVIQGKLNLCSEDMVIHIWLRINSFVPFELRVVCFFFKSTVLEPEHVTPRTIYLYCRSYLNWCQVPAWSLCTPLSILSDWVRIDEFFQDLTLHLIWLIFYWFILSLLLNIWILFYLCQSIQLGQLFSFVFMAFVCW